MVSSRDETLDCCAGATLAKPSAAPPARRLAAVDHAGVFKRATRARPCCSGLSQARIPVRRLGGVWCVPPSPPRASRPVPVEF
jgi:hypothetical protein